jgi:hypothetical protein
MIKVAPNIAVAHLEDHEGQRTARNLRNPGPRTASRHNEHEPAPVEWGSVFPDPRLVAAIVDRVTFNAHIIETGTQSYRLRTSKTTARRTPTS